MDDILASIRRMVNDDDKPRTPPAAPPPEDVLVLDASMMLPEPPPPGSSPQELPPAMPSTPAHTPDPHALVAPEAAAAAASSVGALMRTLASERSTALQRGGPTIEDLVRDEIRVLLKQWLDQHLPPLVERLVRAEIERVVSR